jgi:hypothetical protein
MVFAQTAVISSLSSDKKWCFWSQCKRMPSKCHFIQIILYKKVQFSHSKHEAYCHLNLLQTPADKNERNFFEKMGEARRVVQTPFKFQLLLCA